MTDLDELERLLERATPDLLAKRGFEISCNLIETIPALIAEIRELRGLLREAEVKLVDAQGSSVNKQYAVNLLVRIRAALTGEPQ